MSKRLKPIILLVGPPRSGKTTIADFIAGAIDQPNEQYSPTVGVRIREVLVQSNHTIPGRGDKVLVELWDVSGDRRFLLSLIFFFLFFSFHRYQVGWPAIWKDADAVIFVYNGDDSQQERELEFWYGLPFFQSSFYYFLSLFFFVCRYRSFALPLELKDRNCLVFSHRQHEFDPSQERVRLGKIFQNIRTHITALEQTPDDVCKQHSQLLIQLIPFHYIFFS